MLKDFIAFQLSKKLYQSCKPLRLAPFVKDQLLRASMSVALNLAESSGKRTEKDRTRYFTMALGSLRECEALLELEEIKDSEIENLTRQLGAILFKLCDLTKTKPSANSPQTLVPSL